ncbi:MAG: 50S ribosomal protein L22 [Chloroflexi bacterium]|nr:50S ribosomal protein L22 [Chloroflexota bacterium]
MTEVRALATNQPVSPRKARLVLEAIRGLPVGEALEVLGALPQPSARIIRSVVRSAAANAENNHALDPDGLRVKSAIAGDATRLRRYKARSRGRVAPRITRLCHIEIVVEGEGY